MGGAGSRRKGKALERSIAKQMTKWLGFQVSPTPASGAYGTREGWDSLSGDLMFKGEFPFFVECKNRETFKLDDILSGTGPVWTWISEAWDAAHKHGKRPMLIAKRNHQAPYVFVENNDTVNNQLIGAPFVFRPGPVSGDLIGYRLDTFLANVNPKVL